MSLEGLVDNAPPAPPATMIFSGELVRESQ